jgi:adenosylmethionine-8-amino-7-oxononanoate aminotransferase
VRLAEKIMKLLPGNFSKAFYSDDGSTAVEVALKMALQYWHNEGKKKTKIIAFKDGYHGDTFGAMSASGRGVFTQPFVSLLFEVIHIEPPLPGSGKKSIEQLKSSISSHRSSIAGFIFEPLVLGAGGMMMYDPEPLDEMIAICRKHHILTIADEVMTGFGRTGKLFACEYLKDKPDIICLSKGLTGGFLPLGLTVCTEDIFRAFHSDDRSKTFFHGHSYTANPLACAAALASLDLAARKDFMKSIKRIQSRHLSFKKKLERFTLVKNARVKGTILAFEFQTPNSSAQSNGVRKSADKLETSSYLHPSRNRIYDFFMERRILIRPLGNTIYLMPPYCIKDKELDMIYESITEFTSYGAVEL